MMMSLVCAHLVHVTALDIQVSLRNLTAMLEDSMNIRKNAL